MSLKLKKQFAASKLLHVLSKETFENIANRKDSTMKVLQYYLHTILQVAYKVLRRIKIIHEGRTCFIYVRCAFVQIF